MQGSASMGAPWTLCHMPFPPGVHARGAADTGSGSASTGEPCCSCHVGVCTRGDTDAGTSRLCIHGQTVSVASPVQSCYSSDFARCGQSQMQGSASMGTHPHFHEAWAQCLLPIPAI